MYNSLTIGFADDYEDLPTTSALDRFEGIGLDFNQRRIIELEQAVLSAQYALTVARTFLDVPPNQMRPTMAAVHIGKAQSALNRV